MSKRDGKVIVVQVDGAVLTGLLTNDLNYDVDMFEVTTKDSNSHKEYQPGEDGGTIGFTALSDPEGDLSFYDVFAIAKAKTLVTVTWGELTAGAKKMTASGYFKSLKEGASKNAAATFDGTIQLTGEIVPGTVVDAIAPVLVSAYVNNATPTVLRLTFSEQLDPAYIVAGTAWSADGSLSGAKTVSSTSISGNKLTITMDEAYVAGDTITVQYTKPGGAQDIRDLSGNQVASFGPEAVTNNIA